MKKKDCLVSQKNKKEILYQVVNSLLAAILVLLGAFMGSGGEIEGRAIFTSVVAAGVVFITKFKEYWDGEKNEYTRVFNFVPPI